MVGTRIDGKAIAQSVKDRVRQAVDQLVGQGTRPCLATVLVGDDQASATYVKNKHVACAEVGIETRDHKLSADAAQKEIDGLVRSLNRDESVHGILVQLPLPEHLDEFATVSAISPLKDVDGLTPHNAGLLAVQKAALIPCTPAGVMEILDHHGIDMDGKNAVVINRSSLVGRPLYHLLLEKNATVTTCHSRTKNLREQCLSADVVITAVGDRTKFTLTSDMIRDGAVVIDVAITRHGGRLAGDADYDEVIKKASLATPVPGGVGPMTVAMLLKNTVTAASLSRLGQ